MMSMTAPFPDREELVLARELSEGVTRSYAPHFVWALWELLFVLALTCVYQYGSRVPLMEDWFCIDFITGKKKLTLDALWAQGWSDHRSPLPVLLTILDLKLFGPNMFPLLYLQLILCGVLAAGLIWAAMHVRGRTDYADAFFPVLLLHFGHAEIFLWAGTLAYVLTTFFAGWFLIIQVVTRWRPGPLAALASGTCLVFLPLCYGGGCAYTPFLALSLGYSGYQLLHSSPRGARTPGGLCLFFALLAFLLLAVYLHGYKPATFDMTDETVSRPLTPAAVARTTLQFMTVGFGPAVRPPAFPLSGLIAASLLLVGIGHLATSLLPRGSAERECALGLAFYLMACLAILLAAGYSRATWGDGLLFESRYAIASLPTLLCLYFVWEFCGPAALKAPGRILLFSVALSMLSLNFSIGLNEFASRSEAHVKFERAVRGGLSIPEIVNRYSYIICWSDSQLEYCLKYLRDAQIGEYRNLPPDPRLREVRLALDPVDSHNVEWDRGAGRGTGAQPYLTFNLKDPTYVTGIRIKFSTRNSLGKNPWFQMTWRDSRKNEEFLEGGGKKPRRFLHWLLPLGEQVELPVWICSTLDQLRIYPDKRPCEFTISEIALLLPDTKSPPLTTPASSAADSAMQP
jgi:hypothetical protein